MRQRSLAPPLTKRRGAKKGRGNWFKNSRSLISESIVGCCTPCWPEVDSNKTDKNWNTYQSSRTHSARLRCSDRSRVEVTWPEPKLSKTRQSSSFSSEKERNKKTTNSEVNMNEMSLQQVLKELFWYSYESREQFWVGRFWVRVLVHFVEFPSKTIYSQCSLLLSANYRWFWKCQDLRENWIS